MPPTAPHSARPFARWTPEYVVMMIANAAGVISAAPAPCAARAPIRTPAVDAKPLTNEALVNMNRPVTSTRSPGQQIGDPAAQQQSAAGHQQVRGDQPLQVTAAQMQLGTDGRQSGVDDRDVQHHQHLRDQGQRENCPRPVWQRFPHPVVTITAMIGGSR